MSSTPKTHLEPPRLVTVARVEVKAAGAHKFDPNKHPRDRHGRFIRVGASVDLGGGKTGRVTAVSGDTITVDRGNGRSVNVSRRDVAVVHDGVTGKTDNTPAKAPAKAPRTAAAAPAKAQSGRRPSAARATLTATREPSAPPRRPGAGESSTVAPKNIRTGDHVLIGGNAYTVTSKAKPAPGHTGFHRVTVKNADGQRATFDLPAGTPVTKLAGPMQRPTPPTPDAAQTGTKPKGRPALRTQQRRIINGYRLDSLSPDGDVRRAAGRLRDYEPLTADDATALARALRDEAGRGGVPARRAGALERAATQFDVLHDSLRASESTPDVPVFVKDLEVGQRIRIPAIGEKPPVEGTIADLTRSQGGRVVTVGLVDAAGVRVDQPLTRGTSVDVLPDVGGKPPKELVGEPQDPAVPQPGQLDQAGVGDHIAVTGRDGTDYSGQITNIERTPDGAFSAVTLFGYDGRQATPGMLPASTQIVFLPPAERTNRPEQVRGARIITAADVHNGDRVRIVDETGAETFGLVQTINPDTSGGRTLILSADGSDGLKRVWMENDDRLDLIDRDPSAAQTRSQDDEDALIRQNATHVANALTEAHQQVSKALVADVRARIQGVKPRTAAEGGAILMSAIAQAHAEVPDANPKDRATASILAARLLPSADPNVRKKAEGQIRDLLGQARKDAAAAWVEAVAQHEAAPGENPVVSAKRLLTALNRASVSDSVGDQYQRPAAALAAASRKLDVDAAAPAVPVPDAGTPVGEQPEVVSLTDRIAHLRGLLGDTANFGKVRVRQRAFEGFTLADLAAGREPRISEQELYVPDVAADGGPGHVAMSRLQTVRDAGAAIDVEVDKRAGKLIGNDGSLEDYLQQRIDAHLDVVDEFDAFTQSESEMFSTEMNKELAKDGYPPLAEILAAIADPDQDTDDVTLKYEMGQAEDAARATVRARRQELVDRAKATDKDLKQAATNVKIARAVASREVLAEVRQMGADGTARMTFDVSDRSKAGVSLRWAENQYPTDWVRRAAEGQISVSITERGGYDHETSHLELSPMPGPSMRGSGSYSQVAVHELGHRMEALVPGLVDAEQAYLWHRTTDAGTSIGSRTRTGKNAKSYIPGMPGEVGRRDEFPEAYSGKDYIDQGRDSLEVFTTGIESLFGLSDYTDPDYRRFMLGVLATL